MHIGVMIPNWIGDVVMSTPTLKALRSHFGRDTRITGIMKPYVADVLSGTTWLDDTVFYDRKSNDPDLRTWSLVHKIRQSRIDTMVLLTNSLRAAVITCLSGVRRRIGYVRYGRGALLTHRLYAPRNGWKRSPISAVDYYLELARAVGCHPESHNVELATTDEDERAADRVWKNLEMSSANSVVALNTGSMNGAARNWPQEYFLRLAQRIVAELDASVLILCGPAERDSAAMIERSAGNSRIRSLADQSLRIGTTKACIRRSRLVVSTDSGPRHLAAGFGIPTIAMFGPTDPHWSVNYNSRELHLYEEVPCGPCSKRVCPLGHHRCMRDLTVDRVFDAVQYQLNASAGAEAA